MRKVIKRIFIMLFRYKIVILSMILATFTTQGIKADHDVVPVLDDEHQITKIYTEEKVPFVPQYELNYEADLQTTQQYEHQEEEEYVTNTNVQENESHQVHLGQSKEVYVEEKSVDTFEPAKNEEKKNIFKKLKLQKNKMVGKLRKSKDINEDQTQKKSKIFRLFDRKGRTPGLDGKKKTGRMSRTFLRRKRGPQYQLIQEQMQMDAS